MSSLFIPVVSRCGVHRACSVRLARSVAVVAVMSVVPAAAFAQDEARQLGWKNSTELGLVVTSGNSSTTNFNVRNVFTYDWEAAELEWKFGILRASSDDDRFALGTEDDFEIIEPDVEPDNQRLYTNLRYLKDINPSFFWYTRLFAERDEPADIDYRLTPAGGAGNTWAKRDTLTLLTGYGVSYTAESLTLDGASDFAGYQLFYDLKMSATDATNIESNMTFDGSLETGSNFRFDWFNGVGVNISEKIALKASIRLLYRNDPALEEIDLENDLGIVIGKVVVAKKKLDTSFTTSLVINF